MTVVSPHPTQRGLATTRSVLMAVWRLWEREPFPPTVRDVTEEAGLSSTSVTQYHLERLEQLGLLVPRPRRAGKHRRHAALALTPDGDELAREILNTNGRTE